MTLFFLFLFVCVISFAVIAMAIRPTQDQKALDRRIAVIGSNRVEGVVVSSDLEQYLKTRKVGSFGWIEAIVSDLRIGRSFRLLILQANSQTTLGTLVAQCVGGGIAAFVVVWMLTRLILIALLGGVALGFVPVLLLRVKRAQRLTKFNQALADCIDMMSRSLRAGHSLPAAIGIVAEQAAEPARSEFAEVARQQNFGLPFRDAMNQLLDRVPSQDLRVVATGMLVQRDTGGNLAEVLDRIGAVIRDRVRIQGEIRTHTAQGRLTGWILCLLPVVMLLLINMVNPGYSKPLFHDPLGLKIVYGGLFLLVTGGLIIRQIIRGIEI